MEIFGSLSHTHHFVSYNCVYASEYNIYMLTLKTSFIIFDENWSESIKNNTFICVLMVRKMDWMDM